MQLNFSIKKHSKCNTHIESTKQFTVLRIRKILSTTRRSQSIPTVSHQGKPLPSTFNWNYPFILFFYHCTASNSWDTAYFTRILLFLQIYHIHSICIGYHSSSENNNYVSEGNYSSYYFGEVILLVKAMKIAGLSLTGSPQAQQLNAINLPNATQKVSSNAGLGKSDSSPSSSVFSWSSRSLHLLISCCNYHVL